MECPICYSSNPTYALKGCMHSICQDCAVQMKSLPTCVHPFSNNVSVPIPEVLLTCPYCMQPEPVHDMERLIKQYPRQYKLWLEAELNYDDETERTFVSQFTAGTNQCKFGYRFYYKGDIVQVSTNSSIANPMYMHLFFDVGIYVEVDHLEYVECVQPVQKTKEYRKRILHHLPPKVPYHV